MKILIVATRKSTLDGTFFKTMHECNHQPFQLNHKIPNHDWKGKGLSHKDLDTIVETLKPTASNIHNLQIELISE